MTSRFYLTSLDKDAVLTRNLYNKTNYLRNRKFEKGPPIFHALNFIFKMNILPLFQTAFKINNPPEGRHGSKGFVLLKKKDLILSP